MAISAEERLKRSDDRSRRAEETRKRNLEKAKNKAAAAEKARKRPKPSDEDSDSSAEDLVVGTGATGICLQPRSSLKNRISLTSLFVSVFVGMAQEGGGITLEIENSGTPTRDSSARVTVVLPKGSTTLEGYMANQVATGHADSPYNLNLWFTDFGRRDLFRLIKFLEDKDMVGGGGVERLARKQRDVSKANFSPLWHDYKKVVRAAVNSRRSNVSNAMKAIFVRKCPHFLCRY